LPQGVPDTYHPSVRFACNRCGKRYASTDEPVPGRIYAIGCKCGHTIVVKEPPAGTGGNGARASIREDPFAVFHAGSEEAQAAPPVQPRPWPPPRNGTSRAPPMATAGRREGALAAPSAPGAAQGAAPEPPPRPAAQRPSPPRAYDPVGASHGILLDVDRARALSAGSMASDSIPLPETSDDEEVSITFSDRLPLFHARERPRPWLLGGATALAAAVVLGGVWLLFSRGSPPAGTPPPAVVPRVEPGAPPPGAQAAPPPSAPAPVAPPAPRPVPDAAAPAGAPAAASTAAPARGAAQRPAAADAAERVASATGDGAGPVAAARPARRPGTRRTPPAAAPAAAPATPAEVPEGARAAAGTGQLLDLLSRKADAPAAAAGLAEAPGGAAPGPEQVDAAIQASRADFDACAREADASGSPLGSRRVALTLTANPSGIVTAPRLDDPGLDAAPAGTCIRAAARKLVLPAFTGSPVRIQVPLAIAP
jgi:DNA-directed RNA polymerase subunit RPC12/RpoP